MYFVSNMVQGPTYVNNRTEKRTQNIQQKRLKENRHIQCNHIYLSSKIIREISSRDLHNKKVNFKEKRQKLPHTYMGI